MWPSKIVVSMRNEAHVQCCRFQIARAAAVFNIDEIIVFKEEENPKLLAKQDMDPNFFLAHNLQYLETPQ